MTPRDNFFAFFKGEDYEWVPLNSDICMFNPEEFHDCKARGMVNQQAPFDRDTQAGGLGWFGVDWEYVPQVTGSMSKGRMFQDLEEWEEKLVWPNLDEYDWEGVKAKNADYLNTDKIIYTTVFCGFFERLISFVEFEDAALALIDPDQEETVHKLFARLTDLYIDYIGRMHKYYNVELVEFHDDWGNQRAEMFSGSTLKEMIIPYVKKIVDFCHENGIFFLQHSCGKIENVFENIIESGADTWCGQEIEDMKYRLVQKYADRFIFQVGLTPNDKMTIEETEKYTRDTLEMYRPYKVWFRYTPRVLRKEQCEVIDKILREYKR